MNLFQIEFFEYQYKAQICILNQKILKLYFYDTDSFQKVLQEQKKQKICFLSMCQKPIVKAVAVICILQQMKIILRGLQNISVKVFCGNK